METIQLSAHSNYWFRDRFISMLNGGNSGTQADMGGGVKRTKRTFCLQLLWVALGVVTLGLVAAPDAVAQSQKVAVSAQVVTETGVSVRVKGVELGGDFTVLDVSVSYSRSGPGTPSSTQLARQKTFLQDESGMKLPLKPPQDNPSLRIESNEPLNGQLVFLGHVPLTARTLRLVFNEGNSSTDLWPGFALDIPLAEQQQ